MAMKDLVGGDCGGVNPLTKLSAQLHADTEQLQLPTLEHGGNPLLTQTFNMHQLLQEMQSLERPAGMADIAPVHQPGMADIAPLLQPAITNGQSEMARNWSLEYNQNQSQDKAIDSFQERQIQPHMPFAAPLRHRFPLQMPPLTHAESIHGKLAAEYLDEREFQEQGVTDLQKTSQELLDQVGDHEISNTEFMKFVGKLRDGEPLEKGTNSTPTEVLASQWVEQYDKYDVDQRSLEDQSEVDEKFEAAKLSEAWQEELAEQGDQEYWEKLRKDWDELFNEQRYEDDFLDNDFGAENDKDYEFEEDNPFAGFSNAFEEGLQKLEAGDLISAVLLFEEAVRVNPEHAEAWQYLGTSQAENEQETLAIAALNKCLDLQPDNLTSRLALAVSYTNDSLQAQACEAIRSWLAHHPRYSHLLSAETKQESNTSRKYIVSSMISRDKFDEIHDLLLAAARLAPEGDIDADIQVGLGVLFNISGEYEKAVDCFKASVHAQPNNAQLWNKLGATLANGGRSDEAVAAYTNALELRPSYIRCRYNLGISCVNLKSYREAVEHFLVALNMQRKGEDPKRRASTMSENIWSTLRMSVSLLGRLDLMRAVDDKNLDRLNNEFGLHE